MAASYSVHLPVPFMESWKEVAHVQKQSTVDFCNQSASTPRYSVNQIRINHHTHQM